MAKSKSFLGYSLAELCIPIMFLAVLGQRISPMVLGPKAPTAPEAFLSATGLKHSANWTGGEVVQTIEHGTYQTEVHRPVFDALIGEHKEGFVQVAWRPAGALPARINEEIDADADGQADFRIELETPSQRATLTPYSPNVMELEGVYDIDETLAIRVTLKNPRRQEAGTSP
jgi:hypothetical protein